MPYRWRVEAGFTQHRVYSVNRTLRETLGSLCSPSLYVLVLATLWVKRRNGLKIRTLAHRNLLCLAERFGNRLFIWIPAKRVPLARGIMFESKFSIWHNLEWCTQMQNTDMWDVIRGLSRIHSAPLIWASEIWLFLLFGQNIVAQNSHPYIKIFLI